MNRGIIYLIQPTELIGTHRYKIGCSENTELDRVKKGYKKGTRYILIMECNNPFVLEKQIKNIFNEKFKLIAGYEYFEGEEEIMKEDFFKLKIEHDKNVALLNTNNKDYVSTDDSDNETEYINEAIVKCFKNYKDDCFYGGKKKLIKITKTKNIYNNKNELRLCYINEGSLEEIDIYQNKCINDYFKKIIKNKVIKIDKIYDSNEFQNLDKYKQTYNDVILSDAIKNEIKKFEEKYYNIIMENRLLYLSSDLIVNNICCKSHDDDSDVFYFYGVIPCRLYRINDIYYDELYLNHYIPYIIEQKDDTFYILNRYGQYIGTKLIRNVYCDAPTYIAHFEILRENLDIIETYPTNYERTNDTNTPTDLKIIENYRGNISFLYTKTDPNNIITKNDRNNQLFLNKIREEYIKLTKNKICLNFNKKTKELLCL
jgi:hypothetical protein